MGITQDGNIGAIGAVPVCKTCGSERVVKDAWVYWNPATGLWELENVFDQKYCQHCESETSFVWKRVDGGPRGRVRELNDRFRCEGCGAGTVLVTAGIQARGPEFVRNAFMAVRDFNDFTDDNDPWGEHDYGAVEVGGEKVFWKIDYYDPTLTTASNDPANEAETRRVLTIMLASEY